MKKLTTFLVAVFMTVALNAQEIKERNYWDNVIYAIAQVESSHNPKAVSQNKKYVGYLQMSTVAVTECNNILGIRKYTNRDRYDKEKSIEMFLIIQNKYNPEGDFEKAIRLWNSGDPKCMTRKKATDAYYRKVKKILDKKIEQELS